MDFIWPHDEDILASNPDWTQVGEEDRQRALLLATSSLIDLTNNRVGTPPVTVRPCPEPLPCPSVHKPRGAHDWEPHYMVRDGAWLNACGCGIARWCHPLSEIDLDGPVGYVVSLKIDGTVVPMDTNWRLDDGHLLVWQGSGVSPVPNTQDLNKPDTEIGTWSVTYSRSYPVTKDGKIALSLFAIEFAKAITKSTKKCQLPRGVQSVARNGVNFTIGDKSLFQGGLTGIDAVDQFILKWAPAGSPRNPAYVFDPRSIHNKRVRHTTTVRTAP